MTTSLKSLQKISLLSKYNPTEAQKGKMLTALKAQVALIEKAFATTESKTEAGFQL